jgi:hypothetical protein
MFFTKGFPGDFVLLSPVTDSQSFDDDFDTVSISIYGDESNWELLSTITEDKEF